MQDENTEKQNKTKMDYLWKFRRIILRFAVTFPAATVVNLYRSWLKKKMMIHKDLDDAITNTLRRSVLRF